MPNIIIKKTFLLNINLETNIKTEITSVSSNILISCMSFACYWYINVNIILLLYYQYH